MIIGYTDKEVEDLVEEAFEEELIELLDKLDIIGMQCVNEAKLHGSYKDHTTNLRNSIEYAVVLDGRIVRGGGKQNKFLLEKIESKGDDSLFLVLVAGMEYASLVEYGGYREVFGKMMDTKPYNVIASAELLMDKLLDELYAEY